MDTTLVINILFAVDVVTHETKILPCGVQTPSEINPVWHESAELE